MTLEGTTSTHLPRKRGTSPYVLVWAVLGFLAAGYLVAIAVRPDLVSEHLPIFRPGEAEGNQGQRAMSKALAEVQSLRQSVSQVQLEVAKLRTEVGVDVERGAALQARLTALEERVAAGSAVASAPTGKPAANPAASAAERPASVKPVKAGAAASTDSSPATTATAPVPVASSPIETGSIGAAAASSVAPRVINGSPPAPPSPAVGKAESDKPSVSETAALTSFGPAVVKPTPAAPEPIGLKISSSTSLDALRLSWSLLADRHAAQLGKMEARYATRMPEDSGDPSFDLIAGPVKSPAEAKRLCKALAAKSIPCEIGTFVGPTL